MEEVEIQEGEDSLERDEKKVREGWR
jgi:hypothetical protein